MSESQDRSNGGRTERKRAVVRMRRRFWCAENKLIGVTWLVAAALTLFLMARSGGSVESAGGERKLMKITFLDVGTGDSAFISLPNGKTMLIDGGLPQTEHSRFDAGRDVVLPFLEEQGGKRLDVVVATHPHADHIGGLVTVLKNLEVGELLDCGMVFPSETYEKLLTLTEQFKVVYRPARRGEAIDLDEDVTMRVLGPEELFSSTRSDANNNSIVIKIAHGAVSVLFSGDIEDVAEKDLLPFGEYLKSTILKVPHHGSETSSTPLFLGLVDPDVAVISLAANNKFGHPSEKVIKRYKERGVRLYRTDIVGDITLVSDGWSYRITTESTER